VILIQQLVQLAEIIAYLFYRHSGIFPTRPGIFDTGNAACPYAVFADFPDQLLVMLIFNETDPCMVVVHDADLLHGYLRLMLCFLRRICAELQENVSIGRRKQVLARHVIALTMLVVNYFVMKAFQAEWLEIAKWRRVIARRKHVGKTNH